MQIGGSWGTKHNILACTQIVQHKGVINKVIVVFIKTVIQHLKVCELQDSKKESSKTAKNAIEHVFYSMVKFSDYEIYAALGYYIIEYNAPIIRICSN